jgi:drug/metabolite transporter (DMT)-like permease
MSTAGSILLAMLGYSVYSAGIVLTKSGGAWLKWPGRKNIAFARSLLIWLFGFILYNLSVIPTGIASGVLPPHIISAISGWGIPVIVLLSYLLLKEKLYRTDILFSLVMFAGIVVLSLFDQTPPAIRVNQTAFAVLLALPLLILPPLLFRKVGNKVQTILLATFAGCTGGMMIVIMNLVVKTLGFNIFAYLGSPWPYLYILCGILQFVSLQVALRKGEMILVGPLQNGLMILYPVASSYFVFGVRLHPVQLIMIAVIVFSGVSIMRKH